MQARSYLPKSSNGRCNYAGAVPVDLLRSEQDRLATETAQARSATSKPPRRPSATLPRPSTGHTIYSPTVKAPTSRHLAIYAASASSSTTSASPTPRSLSPSQRWPIRSFPLGWMVRPSREPTLFLATVQMMVFLIGAPGFEPGTSPTRTVRATRLRHAPRAAIIPERRPKARPPLPGWAATLRGGPVQVSR
jgi:hypothetical protein